ncbi:MAG: gamma-glutamylcyclotransferase [Gammaproteobacteria bacterium]|nr:gamma-glutamylcyclotransferase [Gammaproteobacteria bacterium]
MKISYFAFGSNLSSTRLLERIPRAAKKCVAILPGHRL